MPTQITVVIGMAKISLAIRARAGYLLELTPYQNFKFPVGTSTSSNKYRSSSDLQSIKDVDFRSLWNPNKKSMGSSSLQVLLLLPIDALASLLRLRVDLDPVMQPPQNPTYCSYKYSISLLRSITNSSPLSSPNVFC